ncbi:MAG: hypothetical protein H7Y41_01470 [Hyphomonadaceae bacterium]|nr:hypothetical protein [Clostridia bacterium]
MLQVTYTQAQIKQLRNQVRTAFLEKSKGVQGNDVTKLSPKDVETLFWLYDALFLSHWITQHLKGKLSFSLSTKMTKAAGKIIYPQKITLMKPEDVKLDIRIATDFFNEYEAVSREKLVNGLPTSDALEALQMVLEHELCHLLELLQFGSTSCAKPCFKQMANSLFGHQSSKHALPTNGEIASEQLGLNIGDVVEFAFEGKACKGILHRIHKRAVVMVFDKKGRFVDNHKNHYTKFLVPLALLRKEIL